ncbi:MAG TPA: hypothetical protein VGI40_21520 [Pirellulaceae bacterium]
MEKSVIEARKKRRIWASAGIVLALVIGAIVRLAVSDGTELPPVKAPESTATEIVNKHLAWADSQGQAGLAGRVAPIRELFAEARQGTRPFAEEALGWQSKWKLVKDYVTSGNEHKEYLQKQFTNHVFAPEALEMVVQSVVAAHVRHLENLDSELLVRLQADLTDVPNLQLTGNLDPRSIHESLQRSMRQAIGAVESELRGGVAFELVSYLAGEALTSATFKLATSAGILGAGVTSSAMTAGVGLVVSLIADAVLRWAYDAYFDPAGELSRQLNQTLDSLETLILTSDESGPGLIQRLQDYGARRSKARNATIRSAVLPAVPAM